MSKEEILMTPYTEKVKGNKAVLLQDFFSAINHYQEALASLKRLFDDESIKKSRDDAIKLILEVEIPVCLNLAHCYNQTKSYHFAIKYASQVLDQDNENIKALIRRGIAFTEVREYKRARSDF